jgi:uracil-DNA glycosylase
MTILFVGSNPSQRSVCSEAFHGSTRSSQILMSWCKDIECKKVFTNVVKQKTENNRPLTQAEINQSLDSLMADILIAQCDKIVALGKTATKALTLLGVDFYEMPHPSGRNRKLNDPKYVEEKVKGLVEFVSQPAQSILVVAKP